MTLIILGTLLRSGAGPPVITVAFARTTVKPAMSAETVIGPKNLPPWAATPQGKSVGE
jgi:hypothetical protein